jgi:hypothetical protein
MTSVLSMPTEIGRAKYANGREAVYQARALWLIGEVGPWSVSPLRQISV